MVGGGGGLRGLGAGGGGGGGSGVRGYVDVGGSPLRMSPRLGD